MSEARRPSEARKVELIDAALEIIGTQGIAALSTRSLASRVGLSSGAIFRHFATLDALLEAVVERVETVLDSTFPPQSLPPLERIDRFIEARSSAVGGRIGILRLVLSEQFLLALPQAGSMRLAGCVKKTRAFLVACLSEGQATGDIRADVSAQTLAPIVMGTVQMLAFSAANVSPRKVEPAATREGLLTLLRAPTPAPKRRRTRSTISTRTNAPR